MPCGANTWRTASSSPAMEREALDFLFCRGGFATRSFERPPKLVLLDLKLPEAGGIEVLQHRPEGSPRRLSRSWAVVLTSSKEVRSPGAQ